MFSVNTRDTRRLENQLRSLRVARIPVATRETLNRTAFVARRNAIGNIRAQMTLRNTWTTRNVNVETATQQYLQDQEARVGSSQDYLRKQEYGATTVAAGQHGLPTPTSYSAGQGLAAQRTRLVKRRFYKQKIRTVRINGPHIADPRQRAAATVRTALQRGRRFVFLDLGNRKGLFDVGSRSAPKLRMVWDLSRPVNVTPENAWLRPAAQWASRLSGTFYQQALRRQIRELTAR